MLSAHHTDRFVPPEGSIWSLIRVIGTISSGMGAKKSNPKITSKMATVLKVKDFLALEEIPKKVSFLGKILKKQQQAGEYLFADDTASVSIVDDGCKSGARLLIVGRFVRIINPKYQRETSSFTLDVKSAVFPAHPIEGIIDESEHQGKASLYT
jgi:hypothetical protein